MTTTRLLSTMTTLCLLSACGTLESANSEQDFPSTEDMPADIAWVDLGAYPGILVTAPTVAPACEGPCCEVETGRKVFQEVTGDSPVYLGVCFDGALTTRWRQVEATASQPGTRMLVNDGAITTAEWDAGLGINMTSTCGMCSLCTESNSGFNSDKACQDCQECRANPHTLKTFYEAGIFADRLSNQLGKPLVYAFEEHNCTGSLGEDFSCPASERPRGTSGAGFFVLCPGSEDVCLHEGISGTPWDDLPTTWNQYVPVRLILGLAVYSCNEHCRDRDDSDCTYNSDMNSRACDDPDFFSHTLPAVE